MTDGPDDSASEPSTGPDHFNLDAVELARDDVPGTRELTALYESVGWLLYAADPDALARAIDRSSLVITARLDGELVGLARVLTDDVAVVYLQEVVVQPRFQRRGLGESLVSLALRHYSHVRRVITDTAGLDSQRHFAQSLGFEPSETALELHRSPDDLLD